MPYITHGFGTIFTVAQNQLTHAMDGISRQFGNLSALELIRSRGHTILWKKEVHDVEFTKAVSGGVQEAAVRPKAVRTQVEARMAVFELIEGWYNQHRHDSALNYLSRVEYKRNAVKSDAIAAQAAKL